MGDITANEWTILVVVNAISATVAALYVARTPPRRPLVMRIMVGAPCRAGLLAMAIVAVLGFGQALSKGAGLLESLCIAVGTGLFFGLGPALFGIPGAMLGGLLGAQARRRRQTPPPQERIDFGPL